MRPSMIVFLTLFLLSTSSYATNWLNYGDDIAVDTDSIIILNNPKRVTFTAKTLKPFIDSGTGFFHVGLGVKCHSGKQYMNSLSVYDSKDNFIRDLDVELNVDKDLEPGLTRIMYVKYCLDE